MKQLDVKREGSIDGTPGCNVRLGVTSYNSARDFNGPNFRHFPTHCDNNDQIAELVIREFNKGGYDRIALPLTEALDNWELRRKIRKGVGDEEVEFASVSDRIRMIWYNAIFPSLDYRVE